MIAELLAREAEKRNGILQRALRKAARSAFLWPEQAQSLWKQNRSLTELKGIGPFIEKLLQEWFESPPRKRIIAPAMRRDFLSLADARGLLKRNRPWSENLRGDLQMHTHWSDGSGAVEAMAQAAVQRDYDYIAITDHSKGLKIAGGIDEVELEKQGEEIKTLNESLQQNSRLTVLRSVEMNLNQKGEGDLKPDALANLDLVLGSFHSSLRTIEDQTERYLAAIRNPWVHIHGHPRGRIYNFRLGLRADWPRVFGEAARLDKAIEVDSYPDRQDLNVALLKIARQEGVRISLGTDAHHPSQLDFIELGLAAALKAQIPADRIINFLSLTELRAWAKKRR